MTSVNFVLKLAETVSSRVTVAGGASFIKVNGKDWEVGQSIRARCTHVSKKKELMKIFGPLWSEGAVEGKFLGLGSKRKFQVEWASFHPHVIREYGAQHSRRSRHARAKTR